MAERDILEKMMNESRKGSTSGPQLVINSSTEVLEIPPRVSCVCCTLLKNYVASFTYFELSGIPLSTSDTSELIFVHDQE